jgi:hypothetical protein
MFAISSRVKISIRVAGDIENYYVAITNDFGGLESASAALALTAAPTVGYPAATMTNLPVAYWQLNEASGTIATDYFGDFNGTYGALSVLGADGPRPADQPGFASTNTAVQTTAFTVDSAVDLPPLNLGTNNRVTITAWVSQGKM